MKTWSNGLLIDGKKQIDSFNFAFHYAGPAAWEGIRSYLQADGSTKIWKLKEHAQRLKDSSKILGFEIPYSVTEIEKAISETVEANGGGDLYIRPIAYADQDAAGIHSPITKVSLDVYCQAVPSLHEGSSQGITMAISNLIRGYPQYQMQAKNPANYQVVGLAKDQIKSLGVKDVFLLDNQGYVVEATVSNFFIFKGNYAVTPPNKGSILPGVTRRCVAEILNDPSIMFQKYNLAPMVVEKDITKADIYTADCLILCGTYAEVVNVLKVDGRDIGTPATHTYFNILSEEYKKAVRGIKS